MDPIPLRDIATAVIDYYGKSGSGCPEANRLLSESRKFDRKEKESALQLVTFHDEAGRMIFESYVPAGCSDAEAIARASRLIAQHNPLKQKVEKSSVKWRKA